MSGSREWPLSGNFRPSGPLFLLLLNVALFRERARQTWSADGRRRQLKAMLPRCCTTVAGRPEARFPARAKPFLSEKGCQHAVTCAHKTLPSVPLMLHQPSPTTLGHQVTRFSKSINTCMKLLCAQALIRCSL